MEISKSLADNIVKELKDIISFDLNFMNIEGKIIASTNKNRIGQINEASIISIKKKQKILVTFDEEFANAKKGINIPVNFENTIIGTIGITGEPEKVIAYANIIKKMTEILITKDWINKLKNKEINQMKLFLENIILSNNPDEYYSYSMDDISNKVLVSGITLPRLNNSDFNIEMLDYIEKTLKIKNINAYYTILYNRLIILFDFVTEDKINSILKYICDDLKEKYNISIYFGISSIFQKKEDACKKYEEAINSLKWLLNVDFDDAKQIHFEKMSLGILFRNISDEDIIEFKNKITSKLSKEEILEYKKIIKIYSKNNGSITKTSNELFIHKNTLQYKLNKLSNLTSYNPRILNDFVVLKLAFMLA